MVLPQANISLGALEKNAKQEPQNRTELLENTGGYAWAHVCEI